MRLALSIAMVVAFGTSPARADAPDVSAVDRADALFQAGRALMEQGRLAEACPKLELSFKLAPRLGTMLNLGGCFERRGQLARALAIYERAATMAQEAGRADRERAARELAAAVEPRVARLLLVVEEPSPDLAIVADGEAVAPQGGLVPLDPGEHRLSATAPGKTAFATTVTARAGQAVRVTIPPLADAAPSPPSAPNAPSPSKPASVGRSIGVAAGLSLTVGGAVVGTIFGLQARAKRDDSNAHCDSTGCDQQGVDLIGEAKTAGNVSTIAFIGAGVGLTGAVAFFFVAPSRSNAAVSNVRIVVRPGGGALLGSF